MKKVKNPIEYMLNKGLLFEFNRLVLHPAGLSLDVDIVKNDDNKEETVLLLWECPPADKEGFLFPPDSLKLGVEKYNNFIKEKEKRLNDRKEQTGFVIQNTEPQKEGEPT